MDRIYLDHAATTPVRAEVGEALCAALEEFPGNPSSQHAWGRAARMRLEEARERLASVLGAARQEVFFTSGGTMADNLAVLGRWRAVRREGRGGAVVYSAIEHKAVIGAAEAAGREGAERVVLAVDGEGRVEPASLDEALRAEPVVVSVMWGNNEVGVLQPVAEIAARCRDAGVVFHTDAVQALGKVPVRVDRIPVDLLTVTAHKIGGPKGIGALYVRQGVAVEPLVHGGGQERGLHPGTENVAGAVAFALAAELAERERGVEAARLAALRDRLQALLLERVDGLIVNAGGAPRLPHILNVSLPDTDQEALLIALDLEGVAVSSGSACQSGTIEPSHVLIAMGRGDPEEASIRFSVGRTTTVEMVEVAAERFANVVARVRRGQASPSRG
ncbi:MAG TPA: cysteine desulfurase family protein [Longimicrobiales bacterium]